ncbi:hypothetical protein ACNAW0_00040 [Micromonospora sp. SL1-18]|uniref:hypothetical protein n=1 Tax=Micromonospora sp. SL1-18 TaxID=3399128 RepID=UPI003A4D942F
MGEQMGRIRYLVAAVAVGTLLVGCGERVGSGPAAPGSQAIASTAVGTPQVDPIALIGSWTLADVDDATGDILRLASGTDDGLLLFGRCGVQMGTWRADVNGLFVADITGNTVSENARGCGSGAEVVADPWLRRAAAFRVEGDSRVLLDGQGVRVARLLPGARPTPGPNLLPEMAEPPKVTDEVRRALAPATALPEALTPARRDTLLGRWVPADARWFRSKGPYVELRDDGEWRGSDGCNGQGGRWVAGPGGALLATAGVSTLIGCDNVSVGTWLSSASRAGLDGQVLVLFDAAGKETGRLRRDR